MLALNKNIFILCAQSNTHFLSNLVLLKYIYLVEIMFYYDYYLKILGHVHVMVCYRQTTTSQTATVFTIQRPECQNAAH